MFLGGSDLAISNSSPNQDEAFLVFKWFTDHDTGLALALQKSQGVSTTPGGRPDVYTDARTMAWVYDTYSMMHPGRNNLGVVTGKPLDIGGSFGRDEATARGCLLCANSICRAASASAWWRARASCAIRESIEDKSAVLTEL